MTLKQQCENRIRELLPELQELKKGCEVFVNSHFGIEGYGNIQCVKDYCKELGTVSLYGHHECGQDYDIHRVIGSPIALSSILMAIEKVGKRGDFIVGHNGQIIISTQEDEIDIDYELGKSFDNQSEEFYSFLYNIIK